MSGASPKHDAGAASSDAALTAAAELLETGDPDRFAAIMAAPAPARGALFALYALNLEIARAPWASAEPMIGEMRLQWWVDALESLAQEARVPGHEIGPALLSLRDQALLLAGLAEARRADCWGEPFADEAALWAYLGATSGQLTWAAAQALGAGPELESRARDWGMGAGLAAWFTAVPELVARNRQPLPDDSAAAVQGLARAGLDRLARAGRLPGRAGAAQLPGWESAAVLRRVLRDPQKVHDGALAGAEFSRRFGLLRAAFRFG